MNKLTEKHFSFKCPMNWDQMALSDNGRYCGKCSKEVFDLTNCSIDEVIALQRKHGPICGSIRVVQAAAVAVSLSAAACKNANPPRTTGAPIPFHKGVPTAGIPSDPSRFSDNSGKPHILGKDDSPIVRNVISGAILPPEQLKK